MTENKSVKHGFNFLVFPLLGFIVLVGFFLYALNSGDPSTLPSALIGKPVPKFEVPPVEKLTSKSGPVPGFSSLDLAKGKISIVNVWASWCGPCHTEHPHLVRFGTESKAPLYGLNYKDRPDNARRFLGRYGNPFIAVGADTTGRVAIDWGVYGVPETFIVNGKGEIIYKHVGPITPEILENRLLPIVRKARSGI